MSLTRGARLGPYEVIAPAGSGGMGEVWRGRDTRLDRSVAIKVLPGEFAHNAQLKVRFEREARVISQLNHPHICTLYDVGSHDGVEFLVMEYLEGETLADKLSRGPLPVEQVIRYGIEIAEALEQAHKAGVTHRDLKPGNVMITRGGAKLLDFGLAKAGEPVNAISELTSLRTEARNALTEEGTIVGTFQYMAPEQIEGGAVDARTDLFALGALLYEMATGRRAFSGKSKASLIASILTTEPQPISSLQPATPPMLDRIIRTCLAKEPDERFQSAHDVAEALRWTIEAVPQQTVTTKRRDRLAWSLAALFAILAIAGAAGWWRQAMARRNAPPIRTAVLPPENTEFDLLSAGAPPALSPDGTKIVFGAAERGKRRTLWVRSLDSLVARQLAGTELASFPFWSPDGRSIAFFADNALKKVDVNGGAAVTICSVFDGRGGSWSSDGRTIIFAGRYTPIYRVSAAGGTAVAITKTSTTATSHRFPEFLPDGRHFLFVATPNGSEHPRNAITVGSIDGSVHKPLIMSSNQPHYLNGNIIFTRDGVLTAQSFDLDKLAVTDDAVPLTEQRIERTPLMSRSVLSMSPSGTLVYQPASVEPAVQLTWLDRTGKAVGTIGQPGQYGFLSIGPDAQSLMTSVLEGSQANLWLFDERGVRSRLTFNNAYDSNPNWSSDGRKVVYSSASSGRVKVILRDLTTGAEEILVDRESGGNPGPTSWSADGQRLLLTLVGSGNRADIWWYSFPDRKLHQYLITPYIEAGARFSPDGKWVSYQSDASGSLEVYVAPFPPTGAKWQVSSGGGSAARWRRDGKELFYIVPGSTISVVAVPVTLGATPQFGQPATLFTFPRPRQGLGIYDVTRDGQRFVVSAMIGDQAPPAPLVVVQNFDNVLRATMEKE